MELKHQDADRRSLPPNGRGRDMRSHPLGPPQHWSLPATTHPSNSSADVLRVQEHYVLHRRHLSLEKDGQSECDG